MGEEGLHALAQAVGVATEYWDWQGQHVTVPPSTLRAVLEGLGLDPTDPEAALGELEDRRWARMVPPVVVMRQGDVRGFDVHVPHGADVEIWLELESGVRRGGLRQLENHAPPRQVGGRLLGEATFELPSDLPLGYHRLHARSADQDQSMSLVVTPAWLGLPRRLADRRAWGLAAQLYGVRSRESWGCGDLTDLTDLCTWAAAEHDAGFVLVNPLHAVELTAPMEPSPYLPTTRRFANPMYLRPERVPEYAGLHGADREAVVRAGVRVRELLNTADHVDRDAAWAAKREALELLHGVPRSVGRQIAYRAFQLREGTTLERFAIWSAIAEVHGKSWPDWPAELQDPSGRAVEEFAEQHSDRVDFHRWLQWLVDEQLDEAQCAARRNGMAIGIMHDLAVGVHPHGAETWATPDLFAANVTVGCPPDAYSQIGQDWSQPPWRPDQLAETCYTPYRDLVAALLRHAGGIRVDHVVGLFRLWWIPRGASPKEGTYVRYDHEALVGILALEAHRAGAVVVGEDVGTVEPFARDYLRERGILGTSILWFERDYDNDRRPLPPQLWRELAMASVTTHDLPPSAGYLSGEHIRVRAGLGLLARPIDEELAVERRDLDSWIQALRDQNLLDDNADIEATVSALHRYIGLTPARMLCVALPDATGDTHMQNQPGTVDEYPNWRVPLGDSDGRPILLEDLFNSPRPTRLLRLVANSTTPR